MDLLFDFFLSSNKSPITLSEISGLHSTQSAVILAFACDLLAHLMEFFKLLSSINRFLFCCSNSAIANSLSQRDFVVWVSGWKLKLSGSVCVVVDTVLVVQDFILVSEHKKLL